MDEDEKTHTGGRDKMIAQHRPDDLLAVSHRARLVVLAGPTASSWPPPFFARGVHVPGGIRIKAGEKLLQWASQAILFGTLIACPK